MLTITKEKGKQTSKYHSLGSSKRKALEEQKNNTARALIQAELKGHACDEGMNTAQRGFKLWLDTVRVFVFNYGRPRGLVFFPFKPRSPQEWKLPDREIKKAMYLIPTRGHHGSDKLQPRSLLQGSGIPLWGTFPSTRVHLPGSLQMWPSIKAMISSLPTGLVYRATPREHEMGKLGRNQMRDFKIRTIITVSEVEKVDSSGDFLKLYLYRFPRTAFIKECGC